MADFDLYFIGVYQKDDGATLTGSLSKHLEPSPTHSINTSLGLQQQISIGAERVFLNRFCFLL